MKRIRVRVFRGGAWFYGGDGGARCAYHGWRMPGYQGGIGFRYCFSPSFVIKRKDK